MKTCIKCKIEFPATLEYFSKARNSLMSYCKPCNSLRSKIYKQSNSEKSKATSKAWYQANSEKAKATRKAWKQANPEKTKATSKAYRESNPEKIRATQKAWRENNPDKVKAKNKKRRSLKKGNGHEYYTENQVLQTYGTICNICFKKISLKAPRRVGQLGWQEGLHIDHLIPISKGGSDTLENVRPTHGLCNLNKSNKE